MHLLGVCKWVGEICMVHPPKNTIENQKTHHFKKDLHLFMKTSQGKELKAPEEKTVFEEDLSPEEKAKILKEKMLDTHHDRADTFDIAYVHL